MRIIQKLKPAIANQIAAGEVITEPVSVVKELIENAYDAGSSEILIEIRAGGLQSIEVVDNGRGIYSEDAELLFERHATSKLSSAKDLYRIGSLGFRGEALASIAAIAKVTITSRHRDEMQGFQVVQYGSNLLRHTRVAKQPGTSVVVEDLFFNTPVREQFLARSNQLERHVSDFLRAFALGHPEIRFRYVSDDKVIFVTHGDGSHERAIYDILGQDISRSLIPIELEDDSYQIRGFISDLTVTRSNRNHQYLFVNGRLVDNPELKDAIAKAYDGLLMQRRFPIALLWIATDYSLVDVNVHPRKLEVRLSESLPLHRDLAPGLRDFLRHKPQSVKLVSPQNQPSTDPEPIDYAQISLNEIRQQQTTVRDAVVQDLVDPAIEPFELFIERLRPIGQFDGSFLLFEKDHRLILVDQHAAHEKVLYEAFMNAFDHQAFHSQMLLMPIKLDVLPEEMKAFENGVGEAEFGFDVEVFGDKQLLIRAIPHLFDEKQAGHFLEELINGATDPSSHEREALVMRSCKAAIKANHALEETEARQLLEQLKGLNDPYTCPHGRPIFAEISRKEVEKRFERT